MATRKTTGTTTAKTTAKTTVKTTAKEKPETPEKLTIYQKLANIQNELKAPKSQTAIDYKTNKVRYKYRSCEDILEAVKPLLAKYKCVLLLEDSPRTLKKRYYIEARATLVDAEHTGSVLGEFETYKITAQAYAREPESNGRMDETQITGAASSYARKYALNGLFLIDDTNDPDTNAYQEETKKQETKAKPEQKQKETKAEPKETQKQPQKEEEKATPHQVELMREIVNKMGKTFEEEKAKKMTLKEASAFIEKYGEGIK